MIELLQSSSGGGGVFVSHALGQRETVALGLMKLFSSIKPMKTQQVDGITLNTTKCHQNLGCKDMRESLH